MVVPRRGPALTVALAIGIGAVAGVGAWTNARLPGATLWSVLTDLAVGIAFVVAAWLMPARGPLRMLVASVGVAWMLGSITPTFRLSHQAVLGLALLAIPAPTLRDPARWAVAAPAVLLGFGMIPRPWPAVVFLGIAAASSMDAVRRGGSRWFPVVAGTLLAAVLSGTWVWQTIAEQSFDTTVGLHVYEVALVVVALGCWFSARAYATEQRGTADPALRAGVLAGLDGLAAVLADALDDETIHVDRVGEGDSSITPRTLDVRDERGELVATVRHSTRALLEPAVAQAVSRAVQLAIDHERYAIGLERQLTALEEARGRLLSATDRQREVTAARLRADVVAPLRAARRHVEATRPRIEEASGVEALGAIDIVLAELDHASDEILALVAGAPPAKLGGGGLARALRELGGRSAAPVSVRVEGRPRGEPAAERALFYVATEAVTNALKHAQARMIALELREADGMLVLVVSDDGAGGADAAGSGIRGMADRLAARGGRFTFSSPPNGGTVVTAIVPVSRSSSTA